MNKDQAQKEINRIQFKKESLKRAKENCAKNTPKANKERNLIIFKEQVSPVLSEHFNNLLSGEDVPALIKHDYAGFDCWSNGERIIAIRSNHTNWNTFAIGEAQLNRLQRAIFNQRLGLVFPGFIEEHTVDNGKLINIRYVLTHDLVTEIFKCPNNGDGLPESKPGCQWKMNNKENKLFLAVETYWLKERGIPVRWWRKGEWDGGPLYVTK